MNEFDLINRYFADWPKSNAFVTQSIGDDCLVCESALPLVISTDTSVVGRHFPVNASPQRIAQRAFLPAISDLAAMCAKPAFFTLALTLPESTTEHWLFAFSDRLRALAEQYQMVLAGGDTTKGEQLTVTLSVHGHTARPILRAGAEPNDDVWVTGYLGQAAAALPFVLDEQEHTVPHAWATAYWQPKPPVDFAQVIAEKIHSAMDISDGLIGDALHMANRSQQQFRIQVNQVPMDNDLRALGEDGLKYALAGGDDYQLLFTAGKKHRQELNRLADAHGIKLTKIGEVVAGKPEVRWYDHGREIQLPWQSYQHFK